MRGAMLAVAVVGLGVAAGAQVGAAPGGGLIGVEAVAVGNGRAWAIDQKGDAVVMVDEGTGERRRVPVGKAPEAIVLNAVTKRVYVANRGDGTVSVLDGATGAVLATAEVGSRPFAMAVDTKTNRVYVSRTFSDEMSVIDAATNGVTGKKAMSADQMRVAPGGGALLLTGYEGTMLHRLDEESWTTTTAMVGGHNWGMAVDEGTGAVWVPLLGSGAVALLDAKGERTVVPVGAMPCAVAVDAALGRAYVVNYGDETMSVVDGKTRTVVLTAKVGSHPQAVAVDARRHRVYVANVHGDSVTVVDGVSGEVLGTRAAGRHPYALALSEGTGRVYVADMGDGTGGGEVLTVLDGR